MYSAKQSADIIDQDIIDQEVMVEVLHFEYHMEIQYEMPVHLCHFTIKCIPKNTKRQRLLDYSIELLPESPYSFGEDAWGNRQIYGRVEGDHDSFTFRISGYVENNENEYEEEAKEERISVYRFPAGKCMPGSGLLSYYASFSDILKKTTDDREKCIYIMEKLYADFSYVPSSTQIETSAEEAWNLGKGVCQDYAHIYITLLRLAGIPARYVCGLIQGEGESHAWTEALLGNCWVGFDPTHNRLVKKGYIKLGDGRDATDCAINRGIMFGGGNQTQKISVVVEERK